MMQTLIPIEFTFFFFISLKRNKLVSKIQRTHIYAHLGPGLYVYHNWIAFNIIYAPILLICAYKYITFLH